jgi:mono/diheme cytochrome c family protein
MKRFSNWLKKFFFPPEGSPLWLRILPYAVLGVLTLFVFITSAYAWDYTNSPEFCGTACHTMPPEYTAYLTSPHARIDCVDCHIGKGFITTRITRKAGDAKHIIRLMFHDYEFPLTAGDLRPARETCELCHFPEKFSDDSLRETKSYAQDVENTPSTSYLVLKTGGGSARMGLGQGIHWHIENQIFYYTADPEEQEIPFIRVVEDDGSTTEYVDIESGFDPGTIAEENLKEMDCITCHNRITHLVNPPEEILDTLLDRGIVSSKIPEIKRVAVEIFYRSYDSTDLALSSIEGIKNYYDAYYPDFDSEEPGLVQAAIVALKDAYTQSVFPEQKSDWNSHPNNIGHIYSPGCFRCHDGKHLNQEQEAIRLECNLCHSIPVVASQYDFIADIEISRGPEPESHLHPNWISLHHSVFDQTCQNCHTIEDAGGTSNTSFCSNSACHGNVFTYAGFDAPGLREILLAQLPVVTEPSPMESGATSQDEPTSEGGLSTEEPEPPPAGPPTYDNSIGVLFQQRCGACHGEAPMRGLNLTTYALLMQGGEDGPVIIPGDPDASLLIQKQTGAQPHFGQLTPDELQLVIEWITTGAPEK